MDSREQPTFSHLNRTINCLSDKSTLTRRKTLETLKSYLLNCPDSDFQPMFNEILHPVLKLFSDPVEKCRELSIVLIQDAITFRTLSSFLPALMPVLVQRLGEDEIIEDSEEIRYSLIELIGDLIYKYPDGLEEYLDDMIKIFVRDISYISCPILLELDHFGLQHDMNVPRLISDSYPEIKKKACQYVRQYAKTSAKIFHLQSESLIQPLLTSVTHRHSRVRLEMVYAIGDVIQYGNNASVETVVPHLAQRLFDQAHTVREAVTVVVGQWLLDLPDRYSFFPRLIPLLLTSCSDEIPEIQNKAIGFWHDAGVKYLKENENDYKDTIDFPQKEPENYPSDTERPTLGCRILMHRHFSRILTPLIHDLDDWVAQTRIKASQLMYHLLLNNEENSTQHVQVALSGMYRACRDDEPQVVTNIVKSAELLGYFVHPQVWGKLVLAEIKLTQSHGPLMILSACVRGSRKQQLRDELHGIADTLSSADICQTREMLAQDQLVSCVKTILATSEENCASISYRLFIVLVSVMASQHDSNTEIHQKCRRLLKDLSSCSQVPLYDMIRLHSKDWIDSVCHTYDQWTVNNPNRMFFDSLILISGPVVGELLDDVMPILKTNLHPDKDPELRLKFFTLLSKLFVNQKATVDSQGLFGDYVVDVIKSLILPNCVWHAGKIAAANRTIAVSSLWALLKGNFTLLRKLDSVSDELITQLISLTNEDNKSTRLIAIRVLNNVFEQLPVGSDNEKIRQIYPELLKVLDDSDDDVRVAAIKAFHTYLTTLASQPTYDANMYRAHIEDMYKGLLIHMDDPDKSVQELVFEMLKDGADLHPKLLIDEVELVRFKHRTTKYCDLLTEHAKALLQAGD